MNEPGSVPPSPGDWGTRAALPEIPDVTLQGEIARGGMGVVYRGRQPFLDRDVAVKVLAQHLQGEQFIGRFRREARLLAGINHPHIVACHTAGTTTTGQCYLVMEFVDGPSLSSWIAEHGALCVVPALRLAGQIASALSHAADLGVIHRDVKSENVQLETPTSTGLDPAFPYLPKLVDLGLARMTYEVGDLGMTMPGSVMGTLGTMAPEQFDAPDSVDFRADIYGLGCVLYHVLTGMPAFTNGKVLEVVKQKRRPEGPDPCAKCPALPAPVGRLVAAMLAADRSRRPASYRELMARLDELIAAQEKCASTPPTPAASAPPRLPEAPLLQTAEFKFLAGNGTLHGMAPAAFQAPGEQSAPTPASKDSGAPRRPEEPLLHTAEFKFLAGNGTLHGLAAPAAFRAPGVQRPPASVPQSRHRALILAAAASALALAALPLMREPGEQPDATAAPAPVTEAPAGVTARSVTIAGIDGTVRPRVPLELRAETSPAGARGLEYRWSVRPEESATLVTPAAPSTTLRLEGLPGDEFTVEVEVRAGSGGVLLAERRLAIDHPATDLLPGFLEKSLDGPARPRLQVEWTRRQDGAVECTAPELPGLRTRSVEGTLWRVAGQLLPERLNRRGFGQTAVCFRLGPSRQLAVVCERDGSDGERWTLSLCEVERDESRSGIAFRPLAEPKTVFAVDQDGKLAAACFAITRRGDQVDIRIGFPGSEWADHRETVRGKVDYTALTLFVRGGGGVFPKLEVW